MQWRGFFFVSLIYLVVQLMTKREAGLIHAESLHPSAYYNKNGSKIHFNNEQTNKPFFYFIEQS